MTEGTPNVAPSAPVLRVWDGATRLFHWTLVLLVTIAILSGLLDLMGIHLRVGPAILALVLYRLLYGFVGSTTARFSDFVCGPVAVLRYLLALLRGETPTYAGHNPAGGWMILLLLALLGLQAGTGLFTSDGILTEGPLAARVPPEVSDLLSMIHELAVGGLYLAIPLHITAALFYLLVKKDNLIRPMITGYKPWPQTPRPSLSFTQPWVAAVTAGFAFLSIWALLTFVGSGWGG